MSIVSLFRVYTRCLSDCFAAPCTENFLPNVHARKYDEQLLSSRIYRDIRSRVNVSTTNLLINVIPRRNRNLRYKYVYFFFFLFFFSTLLQKMRFISSPRRRSRDQFAANNLPIVFFAKLCLWNNRTRCIYMYINRRTLSDQNGYVRRECKFSENLFVVTHNAWRIILL